MPLWNIWTTKFYIWHNWKKIHHNSFNGIYFNCNIYVYLLCGSVGSLLKQNKTCETITTTTTTKTTTNNNKQTKQKHKQTKEKKLI